MSTNEAPQHAEQWNDSEEDDDMEEQNWDDFVADEEDDEEFDSFMLCLFCVSTYKSSDELFQHCKAAHCFDFSSLKKDLKLDFYGCFKLINYVRSQVAKNSCWACGCSFGSKEDLHGHLHDIVNFKECTRPWDDDKYLNSFLQEDPLLHNFFEDDEYEGGYNVLADDDELRRIWRGTEKMMIDDESDLETMAPACNSPWEDGSKQIVYALATHSISEVPLVKDTVSSSDLSNGGTSFSYPNNKPLQKFSTKISENEIMNVNRSYFGSYSSFGIHREMISDKVRTDAYHRALTDNPSLLKGAVVMDVGCGTGILSLFAAKAGASRVFAVEASDKMAAVASQIAKENGLLCESKKEGSNECSGVINVVHGMIEDVSSEQVKPQSVDVLVSEWMGYCLLYESMLRSVLTARDKWLKPGGAILPDTATMFVAGFAKGATSIPFWEDVYGFSMSCVGRELVEDASKHPIVDVVDPQDIVTNAVVLQTFDLVKLKYEEMNFTATVELEPKFDASKINTGSESRTMWCYGVVLWFENGFTSRFCHENPVILSTSPYTPSTHWSQTIFTFKEPIALSSGKSKTNISSDVGTEASPAMKLRLRVSIARALEHRSIDIAIETTAIGFDGRKHSLPVQIFNLC